MLPSEYKSAELGPPSDALAERQQQQYERFICSDYFKRRCAALLKEAIELDRKVRDATAVYTHRDKESPALPLYGNDQLSKRGAERKGQ